MSSWSVRAGFAPLLAICGAAASCGDSGSTMDAPVPIPAKPDGTTPPADGTAAPAPKAADKPPRLAGDQGTSPDAPVSGGGGSHRAAPVIATTIPDAPPLDAQAATSLLTTAAAFSGTNPYIAQTAVAYLGRLGDKDGLRRSASQTLTKGAGTGGYEDPDMASATLSALVRAGDRDAALKTIALAEAFVQSDVYSTDLVPGLAALPQDLSPKGIELLLRFANDGLSYDAAIPALAELTAPGAADRFWDIAADEEEAALTRGAALAGLLRLGDPRGAAATAKVVNDCTESATGSEVIDGLAVPGSGDSVAVIRSIVTRAVKEDLAASESIRAAGFALVDIRGHGRGERADIEWLRSLIGADEGAADAEVRAALWLLGDDVEAGAAIALLAGVLDGVRVGFDPEPAIAVLEGIGARKLGRRSPFDKAVDAAAALADPKDQGRPGLSDAAARIRLAAAFARLDDARN